MRWILIILGFWATALAAEPLPQADVYVLGERHDNRAHHMRQAAWVFELEPRAVIFEMIPDGAVVTLEDAAEVGRLNWWSRGAADVALYKALLEQVTLLPLYGAHISREVARGALERGVAAEFGVEAARFGLTEALSEAEQAAREAFQAEAHCGALPEEMLGGMVSLQRLRDAALARAVLKALEEVGEPVVVITGNGHARKDWGLPVYLKRAAPELRVFALGQGEDGQAPEGVFDRVVQSAAPLRGDPCAAFR